MTTGIVSVPLAILLRVPPFEYATPATQLTLAFALISYVAVAASITGFLFRRAYGQAAEISEDK